MLSNGTRNRLVLAGCLLLCATARAEEPWETVATGPITVKVRGKSGSPIKEIWAEATLAAPVRDIQSTLQDSESFPRFMPFTKECKTLGKPDADGSSYVYTRLELPLLTARDFVVKVTTDASVNEDGTGEFRSHWETATGKLPPNPDLVRLPLNEGSWRVTSLPNGSSRVVYRFRVDPGGWIPPFAANLGNTSGVPDQLKAVETEARRRAAQRTARTELTPRGAPSHASR